MPSVYNMSRELFEHRMRARRAATCLAVARSAIATGRIVEAIDRLEEACALDPDAAEARLLLEELRLQERVEPDAARRPGRPTPLAGWSHWAAAGIAIGALAALAILWPVNRPSTDEQAPPERLAAPASAPARLSPGEQTLPPSGLAARIEQPVGTAGDVPGLSSPAAPGATDRTTHPVSVQLKPQPVVTESLPIVRPADANPASAGSGTPAATAAPAALSPAAVNGGAGTQPAGSDANRITMPEPAGVPQGRVAAGSAAPAPPPPPVVLPPLEHASVTTEEPKIVASPEAVAAPLLASPGRPADVPEEASLRSTANEAGEIQATLHRYADAYARLDAGAARAIWPTVDERALARAFEGLESQGLNFEHCDVTVAGGEATAACRGRARYVPKVGSRAPLEEPRQWTFSLRKGDAGWQIMQAQAR